MALCVVLVHICTNICVFSTTIFFPLHILCLLINDLNISLVRGENVKMRADYCYNPLPQIFQKLVSLKADQAQVEGRREHLTCNLIIIHRFFPVMCFAFLFISCLWFGTVRQLSVLSRTCVMIKFENHVHSLALCLFLCVCWFEKWLWRKSST